MIKELWFTVELMGYYALAISPFLMLMYCLFLFRKYSRVNKYLKSINQKEKLKKTRNKEIISLIILIINIVGILIMISNSAYILRMGFSYLLNDYADFKSYIFLQGPQFIIMSIGLIMNIKLVFFDIVKSEKKAQRIAIIYLIGTIIQILTLLNNIIPLSIVSCHWYLLKHKKEKIIMNEEEKKFAI